MDAGLFRTILSQQDACRIGPTADSYNDRAPDMPVSSPRVNYTGASAASPAWSQSPPPSYKTDSSVESLSADQQSEHARKHRLRRKRSLCCSLLAMCGVAMVVLMPVWWAFIYQRKASPIVKNGDNVADQDSGLRQRELRRCALPLILPPNIRFVFVHVGDDYSAEVLIGSSNST